MEKTLLMKERSALFIAYEFPPEGCRGTKRGLKFIKYLGLFGWKPIVLTVNCPNYEFHDGTLMQELPGGVCVYRAFTAEKLFYRNRHSSGEVVDTAAEKRDTSAQGLFHRILVRLYHAVGGLLRVADSRVLWLPFAVAKGVWIAAAKHAELIFASGPSFTNHLVGAIVRRLTGIPLVVDFRDAWVSDPARTPGKRWQTAALEAQERFVIRSSRRVTATTDGICDDLHLRYGGDRRKFVTITNGLDQDDFDRVVAPAIEPGPRPMRIVHAGTLGGERSPLQFLKAIRLLRDAHPSVFQATSVIFVGQNSAFRDGKTIESYLEELGLDGRVVLTGFVSRRESLDFMSTADILLLIIGDVPVAKRRVYGISAKIYDYALIGKPVITIAGDGASADMARYLGTGPVLHPSDEQAIVDCIADYHRQFQTPAGIPVTTRKDRLAEFDFRSLSGKLASCFNQVAGRRSRS